MYHAVPYIQFVLISFLCFQLYILGQNSFDRGRAELSSDYIVVNKLRPRQNGRQFADDLFRCIFLNENIRISTMFSLKFVPVGPINNILALDQIMAWRRPGDKTLSELMVVRLPEHICVTRPRWVNVFKLVLLLSYLQTILVYNSVVVDSCVRHAVNG